MNILIPLAGNGKRFKDVGYDMPKPLIEVNGKTMIENVLGNLSLPGLYHFIILKDHEEKYSIKNFLKSVKNDCRIIEIEDVTCGQACSCLLAKEFINNETSLLIANSDQIMDWEPENFQSFIKPEYDGIIFTFTDDSKNNSYVKLSDNGCVIEVAEKKVISNIATCGIYYFKKGADFVHAAEKMINNGEKINNEYYVCPTYNELIKENKKIVTYHIDGHYPIGTPEDLDKYLCREFSENIHHK